MKNINVYILEDNKEYNAIDMVNYKNNIYILLSQIGNPENICIRKVILENGSEYLEGVDTEFEIVYKMFIEKNKELLENN